MVNKPPRFSVLKVTYCNANGILKFRNELYHFLTHHHIDVAFLCEIYLKVADVLNAPDFRVHHSDRPNGYGGTAILIKNSIPHTRCLGRDLRSPEKTTVIVHTAEGDLYLSAVYKPPRKQFWPADISALMDNGGRPFLATGDFNAKHTAWNSGVCLYTYGKHPQLPYPKNNRSWQTYPHIPKTWLQRWCVRHYSREQLGRQTAEPYCPQWAIVRSSPNHVRHKHKYTNTYR